MIADTQTDQPVCWTVNFSPPRIRCSKEREPKGRQTCVRGLSFGSLDSQFASKDSRGARIPPYPKIQLHSFPQECALSICIDRFLVGVAALSGLSVRFLSRDQGAALFVYRFLAAGRPYAPSAWVTASTMALCMASLARRVTMSGIASTSPEAKVKMASPSLEV